MSVALVTGAARGVGQQIALTLANAGFDLLLHYCKSDHAIQQVADQCRKKGVKAFVVQADFSDPCQVAMLAQNIYDHHPAVKVVINNVGVFLEGPLSSVSPSDWSDLFQVNVHAPVQLTTALLPMIKNNQGRIVQIGVAGTQDIRAAETVAAYRCTKVALASWSKSLAKELAPFGVTVNIVSPGRLQGSVDATVESEKKIAAKRLGTKKEVADTVLWLLQEKSCYITGQNIEVAGGLLL